MKTSEPWNSNKNTVYFCGCILDCETQSLVTKNKHIRLRSKLWQVFFAFAQNPDKLISRDTLIADIWHGNNYTGEQGLTHAICHIRRIIKQAEIKASIVTLPKKGYILRQERQEMKNTNVQILSATQGLELFNPVNKSSQSEEINVIYHIS